MARKDGAISVGPGSIVLAGMPSGHFQPADLRISRDANSAAFIAHRIVTILGRQQKWTSTPMARGECQREELAAMVTHRFNPTEFGQAYGFPGNQRGEVFKMAFAS
jgi:hypothetical protein